MKEAIDEVRAYWDRRPCNIRHSAKLIGTREYFDEVEARRYFVEPHIPRFAGFERWRGKRVLEVGCGIGTDAANFARAGAHYVGVDVSETSLALAKKRFDIYGLRGKFIVCNAEQLSKHLPEDTFDLVYAFGVIHHTVNQRAAIESVRSVIRQDGEFRLMLYANNSWKRIMIDAGFDQPEAQSGCPIATTYSAADIINLLANIFEVISSEQTHIFPYIIDKYKNYEYELQPWFKAMPVDMFNELQRNLGWHHLLVARPLPS